MSFDKIKGKLGFGLMRAKMNEDQIDKEYFSDLVDAYMEAGFNYFDTAHGYSKGKNEEAIGDCLSSRYKREDFVLTNKLSAWCFEKEEDILPLFEQQLSLCKVDYFDFYLFHAMNHENYEKHKNCNSFNIIKDLKKQGKIKHIGMSFHDTSSVLDKILTEQPFIEVVQLQFNYLDYDDPTVQSKDCYDVAVKHGKKIIVMEPVKGGTLANLPKEAQPLVNELGGGSYASHALKFVASFPGVIMILSGMTTTRMISDNADALKDEVTMDDATYKIYEKIRSVIRRVKQIPCTSCNYCSDVCPIKVPVSGIFGVFNKFLGATASRNETKAALEPYREILGKCVKCGKCEANCPQIIKIREELGNVENFINDKYR